MTNHQKHEIALEALAKTLNIAIANIYGKRMGFAFLCFEFTNDSGTADYISNAERPDMIKVLRETADRLELKEDIPKTIGEA